VKRANTLFCVGALVLFLVTGCTSTWNRMESQGIPKLSAPGEGSGELYFTYSISQRLNVKVTLENQKAYDAVQMGLYLLRQTKPECERAQVPSVEDAAFFPQYFVMINVDISDGLLTISENEAKNFARSMYLDYQKKIVPAEYLISNQKQRLLEDIQLPKTNGQRTLSSTSLSVDEKG